MAKGVMIGLTNLFYAITDESRDVELEVEVEFYVEVQPSRCVAEGDCVF